MVKVCLFSFSFSDFAASSGLCRQRPFLVHTAFFFSSSLLVSAIAAIATVNDIRRFRSVTVEVGRVGRLPGLASGFSMHISFVDPASC